MITSRPVFKCEYRWDLRKVNSVLIPNVFDNDASLIITIELKSKLAKNYNLAGRLDEILIDYPNRLVASSQVINLTKNYQINFSQQGRFKLEFFPYKHLGRTVISINRFVEIDSDNESINFQPT